MAGLKEIKRVALGPDTDLLHILEEVRRDKIPRLIERDGEALALVVSPEDYRGAAATPKSRRRRKRVAEDHEDIWADYDPQKVREALRKSAGALAGVDRDALLADIHAARQQDSQGRPD